MATLCEIVTGWLLRHTQLERFRAWGTKVRMKCWQLYRSDERVKIYSQAL